jgi:tetrahydromethanopterin S-methyltransferase subunit A
VLEVIREQLAEAIAAPKCHRCGCLHETVEALEKTDVGAHELAQDLARARTVFVAKEYDCLVGCRLCVPAIATNAFSEGFPDAGERLDLCPPEEGKEPRGWPPLPGDYEVVRYRAPVAVCTLNVSPRPFSGNRPHWVNHLIFLRLPGT